MEILKQLIPIFCLVGVPLWAFDARPPCYKELEKDFFRYETVGQALSMNSVGQAEWKGIITRLQERQREAEQIIKEKARSRTPNPLENPFQPDVARVLLLETMYQIFVREMVASGYFDTNAMRIMFDYIVSQDPRLKTCFK